jgi:general secretion pathway protein M
MGKRSRILVIAVPLLIILFGAVVYEYGYLRVQSELRDLKDSVSAKSNILAKYKALIAEKPRLEEKLASERETRKAENSKLLEGQTPSVAAAALQSAVKGMITSRGGTIASERVEKPEGTGKFRTITVTFDAVVPDTQILAGTIYAIETQTPYLVVRELDVRIRNFKDPRDLTIKLKVSGLLGGG